MKKILSTTVSVVLVFTFLFCLASCNTVKKEGAWETASYLKDTTLGKGDKTVTVEVVADEQIITFTVNTDKDTVGDALLEHNLIDGEDSAYGMYVKAVNGIIADYDADQTYWAFYVNGEYAMTGVDTTKINENDTYRLERTKG